VSRKRPVVAIDGPAGAGKTTVTRRVATELGYVLVDTGALYRSVALAADRAGVAWSDEPAMGQLAHELAGRGAIRFSQVGSSQIVLLEEEDVSGFIRTQHIGRGASKVSAIPAVREALLEMQREAGVEGGVVLEGRDIGTVVFPDAEAKFFLTASVDVRARRRLEELQGRGDTSNLDEVRHEVEERDRRDSTRPVAPLKRAPDATVVDSSGLGIDEVVKVIVERVRRIESKLGT
jgi:CMP/dCMP kinase